MLCTLCGEQLSEQARFCPNCGTLTGQQSAAAPTPAATFPNTVAASVSGTQAIPKTETMAIVSLVLGILSLTILHFLAGIPAIIVGRAARGKIRANPGQLGGEGMARAGIIMGWISVGIACAVAVLVIVVIILLTSH